ncbi:UDP-glucose 4-epimerase [Candidatus Beckwithbacteria bacterium CG_4_9_14_0_2_um_filter_47_11]|uniref:UDP-glucose 4-epimerase n=1 Tax=Candidatus Beckwithbacteria bacterium CG_4_9_14_0_2_um_filter_47_11 TaxID=1974494 RepID=A0A2M8G2U4_9BACT|nr:MAG: UDP-glucose 4-epimerase [Candidatus Beckwithbacteria bacterium CG_4_9_14_0_2_um_filter_47_11]
MNMNILVTGGNGFIGTHLVKRLRGLGHEVNVADLIGRGYNLDICSPKLADLLIKLKPQIVYHLAADNRVTGSVKSILKSNVIGTFNVLEACKQAKIKQFIFTSSAAVYGESKRLPIKESWPTRPISAYGLSKLTDELFCHLFEKHFLATIFRFANVYGPGQNSTAEGGVVAIFARRILDNQPVTVYGSGKQTRDFVFVGDVVDALTAALSRPQTAILNIGSNQPTSIVRLVNLIEKLTKMPAKINYLPKRPVEIEKSLFSYEQAGIKLKWRPKTSIEEGLNATIGFNLAGAE